MKKHTIIFLLIATVLLFYSFSSCNWYEPPPEEGDIYVPDSLRLPYETGDIIIFKSKTEPAMYDTFSIYKHSEMFVRIFEDELIGNTECLSLKYIADSTTYFTIGICAEDGELSLGCISNIIIGDLIIEETTYNNVMFAYQCEPFAGIYYNSVNGILRYITEDGIALNYYKHLKQ